MRVCVTSGWAEGTPGPVPRVGLWVPHTSPGRLRACLSSSQGCGRENGLSEDEAKRLEARAADDPGAVLPQHIVPFYLKPALTRANRVDALNRVAGSLSTDELDELTDRVRDGGEPSEVAREWLDTSRFTTG